MTHESLAMAPPDAGSRTDESLVRAAVVDTAAFGELYRRHRETVYRYLRARTGGDDDQALELTAVTFERALVSIASYREAGSGLRPWLLRIARNAALDERRRGLRLISFDPATDHRAETDPGPEEHAVRADERRRLRALVATLPDAQRDAIALRYGAGLTAREIGVVIGKREEATQKLIARAVAHLKETYRDDE